jgi:hypothetical protein
VVLQLVVVDIVFLVNDFNPPQLSCPIWPMIGGPLSAGLASHATWGTRQRATHVGCKAPLPVVLFEAAVMVAEQQQGRPTRERADHLKKGASEFVKFVKRKDDPRHKA